MKKSSVVVLLALMLTSPALAQFQFVPRSVCDTLEITATQRKTLMEAMTAAKEKEILKNKDDCTRLPEFGEQILAGYKGIHDLIPQKAGQCACQDVFGVND